MGKPWKIKTKHFKATCPDREDFFQEFTVFSMNDQEICRMSFSEPDGYGASVLHVTPLSTELTKYDWTQVMELAANVAAMVNTINFLLLEEAETTPEMHDGAFLFGFIRDNVKEGFIILEKATTNWVPIYILFGISIGMGLGMLLFKNMMLGMGLGMLGGVVIGSSLNKSYQAEREKLKDRRKNGI